MCATHTPPQCRRAVMISRPQAPRPSAAPKPLPPSPRTQAPYLLDRLLKLATRKAMLET